MNTGAGQQDNRTSSYGSGGQSEGGGAGSSTGWQGATAFGIAEMFGTPYAGGEWSTEFKSTQTPEQQALMRQMLSGYGMGNQFSTNFNIDPESMSVAGVDRVSSDAATQAYQDILSQIQDPENMQRYIDAQKGVATSGAIEEMEAVNLAAAGKGSRSSAAARQRGDIESDLGIGISKIYADAEIMARQQALEAAGGMTNIYGVDVTQRGQDVQANIASNDARMQAYNMMLQSAMNDAQIGASMSEAEMQYMLGLVGTQTGENISVQSPGRSLHTDIWGGFSNPQNWW